MTEEQKKKCEEHINNYNYKMQDARKWWENTEYLLISLSAVFNKNITEEETVEFILNLFKKLGKPNFHFYNGNLNDNSPNNFLGWLICNYFDNDNKENKKRIKKRRNL